MKDDYNTNSHYLTYTFLFRKVVRMYFLNLGVKGLKRKCISEVARIFIEIIFHLSKI